MCCAFKQDGKWLRWSALGLCVGLLGFVQGCTMGGSGIDGALATNAISLAEPAPSIAPDPFVKRDQADAGMTDRLLDEDTMRLAVTTANPEKLGADGALDWANAATGASGEITQIVEYAEAGQTCRRFKALRRAYDGVTLYNGDVCLDKRTGWWTRSLEPAAS